MPVLILFLLFLSTPSIDKQPDGKWFCRSCTGYENVRILSIILICYIFLNINN